MAPRGGHFSPAKVYLAFVLLSLFVYFPAFDNPFRQDDLTFVRHVRSVGLRDLFVPSTDFAFYRPGALAVYALEFVLFGESSGAYIVFNYLLHIVISLGMLSVLRRMGVGALGSCLASGLFLVGVGHYGKEIMWASTSGPLTSVVLSLLSLILMFGWLSPGLRRSAVKTSTRLVYPLGIFIAMGIAPLFHEASLATAPVLLAMVLIYGPKAWRQRIRLAAPVLLALSIEAIVLKSVSDAYPTYRAGWGAVSQMPVHLTRYLGFMVLPIQRTGIVQLPGILRHIVGVASYAHVVLGLVGVIVLTTLAFKGAALWRAMSVWLVLWLSPFTLVGMPEAWLELRYLYFASVPFCGLLGHGFDVLGSQRGGPMKWVRFVIIAGLVCMTVVLVTLLERQYDQFQR